jgi:hypothetical protein
MPVKLIGLPESEAPNVVGLSPRHPTCPCCAGPLVMLRDAYRCVRCQYTLCVGCEPVGADHCDFD